MNAWLACKLSSGQFSNEFAVSGLDFQGRGYSFFAPAQSTEFVDEPKDGEESQGWVVVVVLDQRGDLALVRLPATTFDNGATITVRVDQLSHRSVHPIA